MPADIRSFFGAKAGSGTAAPAAAKPAPKEVSEALRHQSTFLQNIKYLQDV
jgi:hypothetical protein